VAGKIDIWKELLIVCIRSEDTMSTNHEQKHKALIEKLRQRDSMIRGMYLTNVSSLESLVRDIISHHFCTPGKDEKRQQFISILLDVYLPRDSITDVMERIISNDYPDLLKEYPRLFEELRKINEYSTWLYSAALDTSHSYPNSAELDDTIRLTYYDKNGGKRQKEVTKEEIEERLSDCSNIHFALEDIRSEIRDRILTSFK
jgi:hypothetical protein